MDWSVGWLVVQLGRLFVGSFVHLSHCQIFTLKCQKQLQRATPRLVTFETFDQSDEETERPSMCYIFLNSWWFKDVRNYIPKYLQIQEYKYKYKHKYKYSL